MESALTDRRRLARNAVLNFIGHVAPLPAALIAIPLLLDALGTDRLGVLMLAWVIVGYFGLFDFGIGRALTKFVAEKLASDDSDIPSLFWTACAMLATLGAFMAFVLWMLSGWLVTGVFDLPRQLRGEAAEAFRFLSLSLPFVVTTSGLRGVLEARQQFGLVNAVRLPLGILMFIAPLAVLPYSHELPAVVLVLVLVRVAAWLAHLVLCLHSMPALLTGFSFSAAVVGALLRLGTWITVSNVVGPLMVYFDRFMIGAMLSVAAVAYYATPYEIVTKLWLLPAALTGVLFPAFAVHARQRAAEATVLYQSGIKWTFLAVYPLVLPIVVFAQEGLSLWVGDEFAREGSRALQILALGVLVNCVAHIPFAFLQAAGRADVTAKLHLVELPLYLLAAYWLIRFWGIEGAALAWLARAAADLWLLSACARRALPRTGDAPHGFGGLATAALMVAVAGVWLEGWPLKLAIVIVALAVFAGVAWRWMLTQGEKAFLRHPLRGVPDLGRPPA